MHSSKTIWSVQICSAFLNDYVIEHLDSVHHHFNICPTSININSTSIQHQSNITSTSFHLNNTSIRWPLPLRSETMTLTVHPASTSSVRTRISPVFPHSMDHEAEGDLPERPVMTPDKRPLFTFWEVVGLKRGTISDFFSSSPPRLDGDPKPPRRAFRADNCGLMGPWHMKQGNRNRLGLHGNAECRINNRISDQDYVSFGFENMTPKECVNVREAHATETIYHQTKLIIRNYHHTKLTMMWTEIFPIMATYT